MTITLKSVQSIRAHDKPDWYTLAVTLATPEGDVDCDYLSTPDDTAPVNLEIRKWLAANTTVEVLPYEAPPEVFRPLKPVDFLLGMLTLNIVPEQIDAAIDQMPEPDRTIARIYWTRAEWFRRDDPLIAELAGVFGKTSAEIDAAWRYAQATE